MWPPTQALGITWQVPKPQRLTMFVKIYFCLFERQATEMSHLLAHSPTCAVTGAAAEAPPGSLIGLQELDQW